MPEIVLQAAGLAKAFAAPAGPLPVLTAVSLEVRAGESVSIRGSSGSGKTTLLQLLGGLDVPDAGEVRVACEGALVAPRRRLGRGVGFVFQNYQLMPELTALENVALAARIAGVPSVAATAAARELLGLVGLAARADHLPSRLSGGECQRVALARALVNRPAVLLADEPTGNLDERTAEEIMRLLLDVVAARGLALVLVTHSREFAERASRRLVLSGGVLSPA
ncbi:lipoprotein-releasing system ATP-binding protein LolD [Opitutia bacterium]|nr:lipoprotein-releasing system ATP-binding protein LolD [Opitutae bacterium]